MAPALGVRPLLHLSQVIKARSPGTCQSSVRCLIVNLVARWHTLTYVCSTEIRHNLPEPREHLDYFFVPQPGEQMPRRGPYRGKMQDLLDIMKAAGLSDDPVPAETPQTEAEREAV